MSQDKRHISTCDSRASIGNFMEIVSVSLRGTRKILMALKTKSRMRYSDLAELVGNSTTTRALKAMEEAKLVTRQVLSDPYRPVVYSLTEKGKKASELLSELEKL